MAETAEGPPEAAVAHINAFGKKHFKDPPQCRWTSKKGRVLHAMRSYTLGEVILNESPLHIVKEAKRSPAFRALKSLLKTYEADFDYEPLWYWCAIQSLTEEQQQGAKAEGCTGASPEQQQNLLLLHHEVEDVGTAAATIVRELIPSADPLLVERLIQIWVLNCFDYSDEPKGFSTYFFSSFMSHSCLPNAVWHYSGSDHLLRARRDIQAGDEICISYLTEPSLLQSTPFRRMELSETKWFWCDCERCRPGIADLCRGLRCPRCPEGQIFAQTPAPGPAQDGSLAAAHFVGSVCARCKHVVGKAEAETFAELEQQLQELVDKYKEVDYEVMIHQLRADEAWVDQHFSQHVLLDLVWEEFCSQFGAKRRPADEQRLLQRRCEFHKAAYPHLGSGAHAWILEALGDSMRATSGKVAAAVAAREVKAREPTDVARKKGKGSGSESARAVPSSASPTRSARECYSEALPMLWLMFGDDNEYVSEVKAKLKQLE